MFQKNLNYFWSFGGILLFTPTILILTGLALGMHYKPSADRAFESVEHIMRDVNFGWIIRYAHMNAASFFFIAVYLHIFRGLYFGVYVTLAQLATLYWFAYFLVLAPVVGLIEKPKQMPKDIHEFEEMKRAGKIRFLPFPLPALRRPGRQREAAQSDPVPAE